MANMFKKCKANKLLSGKETAECWFCRIKTQYALTDKQGGEVWPVKVVYGRGGLKSLRLGMGEILNFKEKDDL